KIRILFYTDRFHREQPSLDFTLEPADPFVADFGLSMLRDLILENSSPTTDVEVSLINRNNPCHAEQRLTSRLLASFDELWVIGSPEPEKCAGGRGRLLLIPGIATTRTRPVRCLASMCRS